MLSISELPDPFDKNTRHPICSQLDQGRFTSSSLSKRSESCLFKSMPKEAIWFNERNIAQHKNLGDAFLLRLFKGIIVKVANADDIRVSELYSKSRKEGIMASFKVEQDLMEWEANLWEY